jgi:hypothetical protein
VGGSLGKEEMETRRLRVEWVSGFGRCVCCFVRRPAGEFWAIGYETRQRFRSGFSLRLPRSCPAVIDGGAGRR